MAVLQTSGEMRCRMSSESTCPRLPSVSEYIPVKHCKGGEEHNETSTVGETFSSRLKNSITNISWSYENVDSFLNENYYLEENWKCIINEELTDCQRCEQDAIWKFIMTEKNYVKDLNVLVKHFMGLFNVAKSDGDLSGIEETELFGNVSEILQANETFWIEFILPTLQKSRHDGSRIVPSRLFSSSRGQTLNFKDMFTCYEKYCFRLGEEDFLKYVKVILSESSTKDSKSARNLKQWVKWCERLLKFDAFNLIELLNQPRLRLSQYVMLVSTILYHTTDQAEIESLASLVEECKRFENGINEKTLERLRRKHLVSCLEDIDEKTLIEAENEDECDCLLVKKFLRLPINTITPSAPRCILDKTSMKLITVRRREKVKAFLFSDVLVLTKLNNNTKKYKIIDKVHFLDKIHLLKSQASKNVVVMLYLDDSGLLAETFSFELHPGEIDAWISVVKRGKLCYENCIKGKGTIYDFFKHGDSNILQLFHYKKGKLQESFDDEGESASELVFEDEFIQVNDTKKRNLPIASYMRRKSSSNKEHNIDIDKLAINPTKRSHSSCGSVSDGLANANKFSHSSSSSNDGVFDDGNQSPARPDSIICFRQSIIGEQLTLIDYESNLPVHFLSFYVRAHKFTQTDDNYGYSG